MENLINLLGVGELRQIAKNISARVSDMFCNEFICALAKKDIDRLFETILGLNYEQAFKKLDGFNLTADPSYQNGNLLFISEFFDFRLGTLSGTIFRTEDNGCEVGESFQFYLPNTDESFANVEINYDREVSVVERFGDLDLMPSLSQSDCMFVNFIKELAQSDIDSLNKVILGMTYNDALSQLNSFNAENDNEFSNFDFNYRSLNGTIYKTKDGKCKLADRIEIWLSEFYSPIAMVKLDDSHKVKEVRIY